MKFPGYKPKPEPEYKPKPSYKPKPYVPGYNTTATPTSSEYKPYHPASSVATTSSDSSSSLYYVSSTSDIASSAIDTSSSATETSLKPFYPYSTTKEYIPYPTAYYPMTLSTKTKAPYYKPTLKPKYGSGYKNSNSDTAAFESNPEAIGGNGTSGHGHGHGNHGLELGVILYWLLVLCGIAIAALIITGVGLRAGRKCKEGRREKRERRARQQVRFTERPMVETSEVNGEGRYSKLV